MPYISSAHGHRHGFIIISPMPTAWVYEPNGVYLAESHLYHQPMGIALGFTKPNGFMRPEGAI